jgi:PhnB protein
MGPISYSLRDIWIKIEKVTGQHTVSQKSTAIKVISLWPQVQENALHLFPILKLPFMPIVNAYLNFDGTCEEAFNFYKSVFGGEFTYMGRFGEMPPQEGRPVPEADKNKIMHVSLPIGGDTILMGSDSGSEWASAMVVGNNISLSINADSKADADRFFVSLSTGGKVTMPMAQMFWGDYFGMFTDKFGINWMISFNENYKKK